MNRVIIYDLDGNLKETHYHVEAYMTAIGYCIEVSPEKSIYIHPSTVGRIVVEQEDK